MTPTSSTQNFGGPVSQATPVTIQEESLSNIINITSPATLNRAERRDDLNSRKEWIYLGLSLTLLLTLLLVLISHPAFNSINRSSIQKPLIIAFKTVFVGWICAVLSLLYSCGMYLYIYLKRWFGTAGNTIKSIQSRLPKDNVPTLANLDASLISKIEYVDSQILGKGSGCTIIYKGTFGRLEVAVKKIPHFQSYDQAENEIDFLIKCNGHPNIVQYYASERRPDGYYLALELCKGRTLKDWVINQDFHLPLQIDGVEVLRQATKGLKFLHINNIIHRDLKPSNILFSVVGENVFVKLSDFGISRILAPGINSRTVTSFGGTRGWIAAEMLRAQKHCEAVETWSTTQIPKMTKKLDIFSLGCIFYYVLTNGQHPFGHDEDLYDYNIKTNLVQVISDQLSLKLRCNLSLILKMIAYNPEDRPDVGDIESHSIFWSSQKMINFLVDISNLVEDSARTNAIQDCVSNLESKYFNKISHGHKDGWIVCFNGQIRKMFEQRYSKHKSSVKALIRLIRNLNNHYDEPRNQEIKQLVGEKPDAFMNFWLERFPMLVNETREAFQDLKGESNLKQFYT